MSHENQTKQCSECRNYQPKPEPPGLERHSTGVLLAGVGLALEGAGQALISRGCGDAGVPLVIGSRYLHEVGRRMDAEAAKAPEARPQAETPAGANLDGGAVSGVGPGPLVSPFLDLAKGDAQ